MAFAVFAASMMGTRAAAMTAATYSNVDGDDNVWVSQFAGAAGRIAHLCGVRTENCPPGMKTGDQISPPGG